MGGFGTRALLGRTLRLLRGDAVRSLATLVLLAAAGTAVDTDALGNEGSRVLNLVLSVGTVGFQYWLMRSALAEAGTRPQSSRFGAFFLLGIVSTLGVFVGLVLLIVPGILLAVRWWVAGAVLLDSDASVFESLKESWRETNGGFWSIFLLLAMLWTPALLVSGAIFMTVGDEMPVPLLFVALNLTLYGALIAGWYSAVAVYSFSEGRRDSLGEIFA